MGWDAYGDWNSPNDIKMTNLWYKMEAIKLAISERFNASSVSRLKKFTTTKYNGSYGYGFEELIDRVLFVVASHVNPNNNLNNTPKIYWTVEEMEEAIGHEIIYLDKLNTLAEYIYQMYELLNLALQPEFGGSLGGANFKTAKEAGWGDTVTAFDAEPWSSGTGQGSDASHYAAGLTSSYAIRRNRKGTIWRNQFDFPVTYSLAVKFGKPPTTDPYIPFTVSNSVYDNNDYEVDENNWRVIRTQNVAAGGNDPVLISDFFSNNIPQPLSDTVQGYQTNGYTFFMTDYPYEFVPPA